MSGRLTACLIPATFWVSFLLPGHLRRRREPAIEAVNAAIKAAGERVGGKVKVTAFDSLVPAQVAPGTADALVFPAGVSLTGLPLDQLPAAVVAALAGEAVPRGEQVAGLTLFVCCHAKRDERCGHIGPALAAKLAELATGKQAPGGGAVRVLKTSHVGGHKASALHAGCVAVERQAGWLAGWLAGRHKHVHLASGTATAFPPPSLSSGPVGAVCEEVLAPTTLELHIPSPTELPCSTPAMCWCTTRVRAQTATGLAA